MGRALIVSAGANSNEYIAARLSEIGYSRPVIIPSGAEARRRMSESNFELIVVNAPLPDEFGHELCITAVEQTDAGVVFLVKAAQAEQLLAPLNEQGVLLLNAVLTVREHEAASHAGHGWETFTDAVVRAVAERKEHIVYMLWGSYAQRKGAIADPARNCILKAVHPSPLSAYRGFLGCRHFSRANEYLRSVGKEPIVW